MSRPNPVVRTDAPVRTALPSAQLTRPTTTTEPDSFTYLKNTEEQFNVVIDKEVETLVNGMKEIVRLADLGTGHPGDGEGEGSVGGLESVKDKFKVKEEGFEMELRAESMVRATSNLLSLTHTLKLLFLLSDPPHRKKPSTSADSNSNRNTADELESESERLEREIKVLQREVRDLMGPLVESLSTGDR